jgi:transposase InsO family protein
VTLERHPDACGGGLGAADYKRIICERFHKRVLDEFYRVAFRKKLYASIDQLQNDLDLWIKTYNGDRPHSSSAR